MARITVDSKCRLCRAEGLKLYLKGARCYSSKCPVEKKGAVPPGMHGLKRSKKPSDYGLQLRAKQKAKRTYGVLETQFKNYYTKAKKLKGQVGDNLMSLLEKRLDNIVYVSGLAQSRSQAKQLVSHRQILINGKPLNISSYSTKIGDIISLSSSALERTKDNLRLSDKDFSFPSWLDVNRSNFTVTLTGEPDPESFNFTFDVNLIIEYYSR
ncbi:MAG: 30S ribosomal protein S4 [Candidatus Shapirobacteria bacterium]|jgi:small subunit ribosomal protein S4